VGTEQIFEKLHETGMTARRSGSIESIQNISFVFYSMIFVHKLDIIRGEYVVCLQILSAATLPNIIKIGQHLPE